MRILRLTLALVTLALLLPLSRAQDAVLVLTPSPVTSVVAGNGAQGLRGDGAPASSAQLAAPSSLARDAAGNLYIADTRNHRIRRIDPSGNITTVAGTGAQGFSGDDGPAATAQLDSPAGVAVSSAGILYIADTHNHRIRCIDRAGVMHTVAGTGTGGSSGDGALATAAQLSLPAGIATGLTGDLYIADTGNHRVRHVGADGRIATVAGDGAQGRPQDGALATAAHLDAPVAVAVRPDGAVLIVDRNSDLVLILATDGTLRPLSTRTMSLRRPAAVTLSSFGDTYIADSGNHRVAQIGGNGAASALGSGEQGALDPTLAPVQTPLGSPMSVLGPAADDAFELSVLDRDRHQLVQVSLPRITFPDTVVASASSSRTVLLRNAGKGILSVNEVVLPASFTATATSSCGSVPFQLRAGASCNLDLQFTPQTDGPSSGMLELSVGGVPPQRVALSGRGLTNGSQLTSSTSLQTSAGIAYAGTSLTLTAAVLGGSATPATGTVTFLDGTTPLASAALTASAQASVTTAALPAGAHTLTAQYSGDRRYLRSGSPGVGVTVAAPPDFTVAAAASGSRVVLQGGSAGNLALVLQPVNGVLNQTVTIVADGLPSGSALSVTPVPVTLVSDPVTVTVAFKLPVSLAAQQHGTAWLACIAPLLAAFHRKRRAQLLAAACLVCLPVLLQGCGGGYLSGSSVTAQSAASTYAVTITAACPGVTGATLTHSTTFTVVVQR